MSKPNLETLEKARKFAVKAARERAESSTVTLSARSNAHLTLVAAEQKFNLGGYGIECLRSGTRGGYRLYYINQGDTYDATLYAIVRNGSARFYVGSWGDRAEQDAGLTTESDFVNRVGGPYC